MPQKVFSFSDLTGAMWVFIEYERAMNRAMWYLIVATSLFSVINVGVKFLGHLPASEVVVFRAVANLALSLFFIWRKGLSFRGNNRRGLFLRGLMGTVSLMSFFYCIQNVPLAVATTLFSLVPIITVIIGHFYLKEKATFPQWCFFFLAFLGVILVRGGLDTIFTDSAELQPVSWFWIGLGLLAACFAAITYTVVRELRLTDDPLLVMMYFPLVTIPLVSPVMIYQWQTPRGVEWLILLGIGTLTQAAQWFMTMAYQMEKASNVMIFNYTGLFWGALFGWTLFNEKLSSVQLLGILLVFICLCGNYYVSMRRKGVQTY